MQNLNEAMLAALDQEELEDINGGAGATGDPAYISGPVAKLYRRYYA